MSPMPRKQFVITGQRFGRGVVVDPEIKARGNAGQIVYRARLRCDCGNLYEAVLHNLLKKEGTKSCGCWRRDLGARLGAGGQHKITHGLSGHPLFTTWRKMIDRCENPRHPGYHRYGGRGITVCEAWHDPAVFITWIKANLGPRPDGMSLDRYPDNDGNYEPGNVRWATPREQAANRTRKTT